MKTSFPFCSHIKKFPRKKKSKKKIVSLLNNFIGNIWIIVQRPPTLTPPLASATIPDGSEPPVMVTEPTFPIKSHWAEEELVVELLKVVEMPATKMVCVQAI